MDCWCDYERRSTCSTEKSIVLVLSVLVKQLFNLVGKDFFYLKNKKLAADGHARNVLSTKNEV